MNIYIYASNSAHHGSSSHLHAGIVDRIHWKVQGVRQYLFSKSLRKDRSGGEGSAGVDGGDDTVIWKYFSEYCSIKEEQDNDDKVMGEWVSACLVASKDTIEWTQMSIYMHPMIQLIMAPVHTYRSLGPI